MASITGYGIGGTTGVATSNGTRSSNFQAFYDQYKALAERAELLQGTINNQAKQISDVQSKIGEITDTSKKHEKQNEESAVRLKKVIEKSEKLIKEAENMRLLAGASTGFATGLAAGISVGASGGTLALYSGGGIVLGIGSAAIHNQNLGEK